MRFEKGFYDQQTGRYRGRSYGLGWAALTGFFGVFGLAILIGLPLFIHGWVGWLLEVPWLALVGLVTLLITGPRGSHSGGARPARSRRAPRVTYQQGMAPGALGLRDLEAEREWPA